MDITKWKLFIVERNQGLLRYTINAMYARNFFTGRQNLDMCSGSFKPTLVIGFSLCVPINVEQVISVTNI